MEKKGLLGMRKVVGREIRGEVIGVLGVEELGVEGEEGWEEGGGEGEVMNIIVLKKREIDG